MLGSIPREMADLSVDFQFTVQKNEIKYFVLEQINKSKQKRRTNLLTCLKHLWKPLLNENMGRTKTLF